MKAQFATIEAIMALLVVIAVAAFTGNAINRLNTDAYSAREALASSFAVYDFLNQASSNRSLEECMALYLTGNQTCASGYLEIYRSLYGLRSFGIALGNGSEIGDGGIVRCFPYRFGTDYEELCIEAG